MANNVKLTREQLQRRLDKAVLHIDRTKGFKSVYFADRGIRIVVEDEVALIGRQSFTLMFDKVVSGGYSRIYIILSSIVDMANRFDCTERDSRGEQFTSFYKLRNTLRNDGQDGGEYNVFVIFTAWFDVIQSTLFLAPEKPDEMWSLNSIYALNTIVHGVVSKPYEKDMSNRELWDELLKEINEYSESMNGDYLVLRHRTKEEQEKELADALAEMEIENQTNMEGIKDESKD